jgi:hypothetical protein
MSKVCAKEVRRSFENVLDKEDAFITAMKISNKQIKFDARITKPIS